MVLKTAFVRSSLSIVPLLASGCGLLGGNPTQGIAVSSKNCIEDPSAYPVGKCLTGSDLMTTPNVPVWGNKTSDYYAYVNGQSMDQTLGTVAYFGNNGDPPSTTGASGVLVVNNAEAPAYWNLNWLQPWPCGYNADPSQGPVYEGEVTYAGVNWWEYTANGLVPNYYASKTPATLLCYTPTPVLPASTRFAILGNLPNTLTLGSAVTLTTQFGMPLLYVYDKTGEVVSTLTATGVDSSGTQATFPFPSTLSQSGYSVAIVNQTGAGDGFVPAGNNLLSIASRQIVSGNPFGVSVGGQTYTTVNCIYVPIPYPGHGTYTQCTSGATYNPVPVVSLYSAGQALINGTRVDVGPNPTAVVAYTAGAFTTTTPTGNGYTTFIRSGATRAAVANSGNNTVTILDIVNDVPLTAVTVGNNPVALAVSSDGTAGYVANYADSTISRIDLTTDTVTSTVAVGGNPTSVALTSAGILWVGGAGFLTEINTQTMSVIGTEAAGRNIIALAYSDTRNELAVTTVDSNANVYADEIAPGTFHAGGTYTPVASNMISGLGTYTSQPSGQRVRAFSSMLASSTSISANQVGAPPLVVQDDWAVVTATPTGFTISDLSGHVVLINEKTPSPVTAIAVDSNLHVAYLTMPDSNTLLMVPLPGVN